MNAFRSLALAAALIGAASAPALAQERFVPGAVSVPGPVASEAWTALAGSRTVLAADGDATPAQNFLERSGATGGGGQHS